MALLAGGAMALTVSRDSKLAEGVSASTAFAAVFYCLSKCGKWTIFQRFGIRKCLLMSNVTRYDLRRTLG